MNIYTKLTLLVLFIVITSSAVLIYFTNKQFEKTLRDQILSNVTQQSKESINNIQRFIFSRLNDVRTAAKNPYFRITDISSEGEELNSRLKELEELNDLYFSFSLFDMERMRVADSKGLKIGEKHGDRLYWKRISPTNESVMDISRSESVDRVVMHFASIVRDYYNDEEAIGVLVGRVPVDELYQILGQYKFGQDENNNILEVNLIRDDGIILYSNKNSDGILIDEYEQFDLVKGIDAGNGVQFLETDDYFYFVSEDKGYLNYAGNNWKLILSIKKNAALAPLKDMQQQVLWVFIPVIALAIFLALISANIFVRPIVRLSKSASEIGKGNLTAEIKVGSNDEVGKLATELKNTAQVLIERIDEQKQLNAKLEDQKNAMEEQKNALSEANEQITASINYAMRIQHSMLPDTSELRRLVSDAFIFYRPKDIVSGDFYWFEKVRRGRNEYAIIVGADCTGHGVPGAIMSMMGSNQLTNIVYYQNYIEPEKILARLDKAIKFELYRDEDSSQKQDGMEIAICVVDLDTLKMKFAGAGMPIYASQRGVMQQYKSPKLMIGGMEGDEKEVEEQFNPITIQLTEGDKLYLASDGYQDQFGGTEDKRFMGRNFRALLDKISNSPMPTQHDTVVKTFEDWKGDTPQTDDVLFMGIEF